MPCVKELEDVMEGQALLQATSALEDSKLQHLSNRTKGEMVKQNKPMRRKSLYVEGLRTSSYVAFLSQPSRSKGDLMQRLQNILNKAVELEAVGNEVEISLDIVTKCRNLLHQHPEPTKAEVLSFLVHIAQSRNSEGIGNAFVGGVLSAAEVEKVNASRALKAAVQKLSPSSLEGAAAAHAQELLEATLQCTGRDSEKALCYAITCMIRYCDITLCDPQQRLLESAHELIPLLRKSQTELQASQHTFSDALTALQDFTEHPSQLNKCKSTLESLEIALENAEQSQSQLILKAISLAKRINSLYDNKPLGPTASVCMAIFQQFFDIIEPFISPFKFTRQELIQKMEWHPQKLFHAHHIQLILLSRVDRPMASFILQQSEGANKLKKRFMESMFSFTDRPVGNGTSAPPLWRNKNGYWIAKTRVKQLFYHWYTGRQKGPYKCSKCGSLDHTAASKDCPNNVTEPTMLFTLV